MKRIVPGIVNKEFIYLYPKDWPAQWNTDFSRYEYLIVNSLDATDVPSEYEKVLWECEEVCYEDFEIEDLLEREEHKKVYYLYKRKLSRVERLMHHKKGTPLSGKDCFNQLWPVSAGKEEHMHAIDHVRWSYLVLDYNTAMELQLTPADGWRFHNWDVIDNVYRILYRRPKIW